MGSWVLESEPLLTMKGLITDNWYEYSDVPLPEVIITNEDEGSCVARFNLLEGDCFIIKTESSEIIRYRGNIQYYDRIFPITVEIWTKESRQRLRDLWKMFKIIIWSKKHNFTGYQLIRLRSYRELTNEQLNIWRAVIDLDVESCGVAVETLA